MGFRHQKEQASRRLPMSELLDLKKILTGTCKNCCNSFSLIHTPKQRVITAVWTLKSLYSEKLFKRCEYEKMLGIYAQCLVYCIPSFDLYFGIDQAKTIVTIFRSNCLLKSSASLMSRTQIDVSKFAFSNGESRMS